MSHAVGPVPGEFKSVYRLFLRTVSRAAGPDRHLFISLRRLYRPVFRAAGRNVMKLDDAGRQSEHENLRKWLATWDRRVDNTMAFLTNGAMSYGLPLSVLRNLPVIERGARQPAIAGLGRTRWNPHLPEDDKAYKIQRVGPNTKLGAHQLAAQAKKELLDVVFNPVGEVIKLAEGRHDLSLGRMIRRRYVP